MKGLGLTLQLVGLVVAFGALGFELLAMRSEPDVPKLADNKRLINQPNPWKAAGRHRITTQLHLSTRPNQDARQVITAAVQLANHIVADRERALKAWDDQAKILDNLSKDNAQVLESQIRQMSGLHRSTRIRVFVEMGGLALTALGTVLSSLAN